ncbi:heterodisulfide reductase-related iron-sulfur binding cluster [Pedobacter vanadiisoli]|uniref:Heterodisulfide reductase-related iron-sulfur binding cluster n=1 Tax=Pedobacter vanadiisoli TaxID=1761975 RepID=A0ABW5MDY8_9SPHI
MKSGLFTPCYIDQLYPKVAIATSGLPEKLGLDIHFPIKQTCCRQLLTNSGYSHLTTGMEEVFVKNSGKIDYIVPQSGNCTLHVKDHLHVKEHDSGSYGYGVFIAGLSKTAAIEQSLAIGAHSTKN